MMLVEESEIFQIKEDEVDLRIDKILVARFHQIKSRSYFEELIEKGHVLLNGSPVKKRLKPKLFDEVEVNFMISPSLELIPENIPLTIVFEDEDLLVVNKPAGMVVHPAPGHWSGTFVHALLYHCKDLFNVNQPLNTRGNYPRPGIVHRLDKETSGLLIAAKNAHTHERLTEMFAKREIYKEYLALCIGSPKSQEICNKIGRHPVKRKEMAVLEEGGKEAITSIEMLRQNKNFSLVKIILKTGRTHQIRVHMKHIGHSILGCQTYGVESINKKWGVKRQFLHASFLRFKHPVKGTPLEFVAEVPEDMRNFMTALNF